ncbi:MAG: DUF5683 domain-containing protein [Bacteroidaceae bacterium]|nr:DUF5683 domain-containing protein [Bacteroidaceae bacterium]
MVLLHLVLWCGGTNTLWAQQPVVEKTDTIARQDSIPQTTKRDRKTARGNSRKEKIAEKADSVALKKQQEADSVKVAAAALKRNPEAAKEQLEDKLPKDSAELSQMTDSLLQEVLNPAKKSKFKPDPIRSMWLGLVFPGGGQIYNRKYWKLPIFYGGFLGCAYALTWNGQMLRDYSQAYLDIMDTDPNTKSYEKMLPLGYDITGKEERFKTIFKNKKNYFRKYRDMSIFAFAGVYMLAVIDAYVDAELSSFDISKDLSMSWGPTVIQQSPKGGLMQRQTAPGIQCNITF